MGDGSAVPLGDTRLALWVMGNLVPGGTGVWAPGGGAQEAEVQGWQGAWARKTMGPPDGLMAPLPPPLCRPQEPPAMAPLFLQGGARWAWEGASDAALRMPSLPPAQTRDPDSGEPLSLGF